MEGNVIQVPRLGKAMKTSFQRGTRSMCVDGNSDCNFGGLGLQKNLATPTNNARTYDSSKNIDCRPGSLLKRVLSDDLVSYRVRTKSWHHSSTHKMIK